jgi:hypothetical protein
MLNYTFSTIVDLYNPMGKDWLNYMLSSFAASQRLLLHLCVDYFSADSKSLKIWPISTKLNYMQNWYVEQ